MKVLAISDVEEAWLTTYYDRDRMADAYRQLLTGRQSGPDDVRQ